MPLTRVLAERPDVFNHNGETVPRLYSIARRDSTWERSNRVLRTAKEFGGDEIATKSGPMVGLGERFGEVIDALATLRESGVQGPLVRSSCHAAQHVAQDQAGVRPLAAAG